MKDIAEGQVKMQQMLVITEGLIAYMKPTPAQAVVLKRSLISIARTAMEMQLLVKEN